MIGWPPAVPGKSKDADPADNAAPFSAYTAANPADLSISATPAQGHVGDTVPVTLTVANAGPGDVLNTVVKVTAPGGTEFTAVDLDCKATTVGKDYTCEIGLAPAGAKGSGVFQVKVLSATVTDGKAEVSGAAKDKNPGNNTAAIKVMVLTGAPGGVCRSPAPRSGSSVPSASGRSRSARYCWFDAPPAGSSDPAHRLVHHHIEPEAGTLGMVQYAVGDLVAAEKLFTRCPDRSEELSCKPSLFETVTPVSADSP